MAEPTVRPSIEHQLLRLSRMAEDIGGQLAAFRETLGPGESFFPSGAVERLRQLSGSLLLLRQEVSQAELERRDLQALADIGRAVNSSLDLTTVLNQVIDTIIRLTGAERAFLMLQGETAAMEIVVARNWERATLDPSDRALSSTVVDRVLQHGESILTTNAQEDPRFRAQESVVAYNLRSILCVPLKLKGALTGVIYADNRGRAGLFTERDRSLLSLFADQAAVALENARLFDSVRRTLDQVTELKNLMEDVLTSIASGVITADVHQAVILCNQAAQEILALPRERLVGASLATLLHPISDELAAQVGEVMRSDSRIFGLEAQPVLPGRGRVELSFNLTPLKDADRTTHGVAIVVDDLTEKRRLQAQRRLFGRMVSPAVIEQLDPDSLSLVGHRVEITTVFADLRGFTAFSESLPAEALVKVLNRYLAAAAEAILAEGGTIDKYLGDAVMAWFNAPLPQPDHSLRAARAALSILAATQKLHAEFEPALRLSFGVGIHRGEAILGLVGTKQQINYTAIGDSVNTAKRLQENAGAGQILMSRAAVESAGDLVIVRPMPAIQVEGKSRPVEACELLGLRSGPVG